MKAVMGAVRWLEMEWSGRPPRADSSARFMCNQNINKNRNYPVNRTVHDRHMKRRDLSSAGQGSAGVRGVIVALKPGSVHFVKRAGGAKDSRKMDA